MKKIEKEEEEEKEEEREEEEQKAPIAQNHLWANLGNQFQGKW